jgi:hypothetical protein
MSDLLTVNIRRKLQNKQTVTPAEVRSLLYIVDTLKAQNAAKDTRIAELEAAAEAEKAGAA